MKILNFLFRDFWRKLVALIFAVVIYWQISGLIKQKETKPEKPAPAAEKADRNFTVRMLDGGMERRATFPAGEEPKVKVTLLGMENGLAGIQDGDLIFYVDIPEDLKPGKQTLPVRCHIRRSGVKVLSVEPKEIKIIGNPIENHK